MLYCELIQRLFQVNLFGGVKLGLNNSYRLQSLLGFPDQSFASIHVAGTNGKGSVVTKIALGLQAAGYRVGLYTSPHLSCFRERIRVNGEMISEKLVEEYLAFLFDITAKEHIPATFFELTTFLALLHFAKEKVDFAVLETGLGGRLDATNIVTPILSVITSISLDHTETLGHTIEAIAEEKAGIIKPWVPILLGPKVPFSVISPLANQQKSPCYQILEHSETFEEENCSIAQAALEHLALTFNLPKFAIEKGLEGRQPCRFEIILKSPTIILDVAHNPDGLTHLFKAVHRYFPNQGIRVLCGLSKNKDIKGCLKIIAEAGTHFHLVEAPNGRGAPIDLLYQELNQLKIHSQKIERKDSISSSVESALQQAKEQNQILVICGSFFIMNQVRQVLGILEPQDEIDLNERASSSKIAKLPC